MIFIDFEGSNFVVPDESAPAYAGRDERGMPFVVFALKPNKEDIEAIQRGEPIYIRTIGPVVVPFVAYTFDEQNELNA